jgi:hypothetical protein
MTATAETQQNGRVRKTLSSQLDRLDTILDGLSDALNESVSAAVEKAVGNVITEILTNPTFTDRLRAPVHAAPIVEEQLPEATAPPPQRGPGLFSKVTGAVRAGWGHVQRAGSAVLHRAAAVADTALSYVTRLLFRGRILSYAAALITLVAVAFFAMPRLPLLLTAVAGWMTALLARARSSLRPTQLTCDLDTH